MNRIIAALGIVLLSGCEVSKSTSITATQDSHLLINGIAITREAKTLYPELNIEELESFCDSSQSKGLVGCYVSETCSANENESKLLVTSFSKDGQLRSKVLFFANQAGCTSSFTEGDLNEHDLIYSSTSESEKLSLDSEHHFDAGSLGTFVTKYVSSYDLNNNRLCFPDSDYNWGTGGGNLSFTTESDSERPTNIDFSNCMVRLNI